MKRHRLKVFSKVMVAKHSNYQFASVEDAGRVLYYDELVDGADIWELDADGNPVVPEDGTFTVDGVAYDIVGGVIKVKPVEEPVKEEMQHCNTREEDMACCNKPEGEDDKVRDVVQFDMLEDTFIQELVARIDGLYDEIERLKSIIEKPAEEAVKVDKYSKVVNSGFDLSKFGL